MKVLLFVTLFAASGFACDIPPGLLMDNVTDPCWTAARIQEEYVEAEARVALARYVQGRPYTPLPFNRIVLIVSEHPDGFDDGYGHPVMGLFRSWPVDQIEYSLKHEKAGPFKVIRHELGHFRELKEQQKHLYYDANEMYSTGWWSFGHGTYLDPMVIASNLMIWWFNLGSETHSYYPAPGKPLMFAVGRPPDPSDPRAAACILEDRQ